MHEERTRDIMEEETGEGSEDGFGVRRSSDCTTHLDEELDMLEETQREEFYIPWIERVPEAHVPKEG
jgi:hypothetical protein